MKSDCFPRQSGRLRIDRAKEPHPADPVCAEDGSGGSQVSDGLDIPGSLDAWRRREHDSIAMTSR